MSIIACSIASVVIILAILWVLKWADFTIIPPEMQLPEPGKFVLPMISRNRYTWKLQVEDEYSKDNEGDINY